MAMTSWQPPAFWLHVHRDSMGGGRKCYAVDIEACDGGNTVESDAPGLIKTPCDAGMLSDWCKGWVLYGPRRPRARTLRRTAALLLLLALATPATAAEPTRPSLRVALSVYAVSVGADAWTTQSAFDRATPTCIVEERNDAIAWVGEDRIAPTAVVLGGLTTWGLYRLGRKYPRTATGLALGMSAIHLYAARSNRWVCR